MTREEAIAIARIFAEKHKPSYYSEPFQPHEWVVEAIISGYYLGHTHAVLENGGK